MGTKQLMADRRVASVELDDKGKASILTLADGWAFGGGRGPFTLTNVEHGHQIVRGAEPDGSVAVNSRAARRTTKKPQAANPEDIPEPNADTKPISRATAFAAPREKPVDYVYRLTLCPIGTEPKGTGHEVCGWLKTTKALPAKALAERTWAMLAHHVKLNGKTATDKTHEVKSFRWTNAHQADAMKRDELGAPFKDTNYGDK